MRVRNTISGVDPNEADPAVHGNTSTLRADRKRLNLVIRKFFKIAFLGTLLVGATLLFGFLTSLAHTPSAKPWLPCLSRTDPVHDVDMIADIKDRAEHAGAWCSTKNTPYAQPCLCCVAGAGCWREARSVYNGSETAMMRDRVDTEVLDRRLPTKARFCYLRPGSDGAEDCKTEEDWRVGYVLRAMEMRYGWAPAGQTTQSEL